MEQGVVFAGFGGQGILLAGKVLARAGMEQGLEVSWLPSYGPEMRGGTANCTVVLSDKLIGAPIVDAPWALVAMNTPSLDRFEPQLAEGGLAVINSSLVERAVERTDLTSVHVPVTALAHSLEMPRAGNMVALGALLRVLDSIPLEAGIQAMAHEMEERGRESLADANRKALELGYEEAGKVVHST
ncbi:MAG: 2-oxoacid:acceptor oxidoreductase family protein [Candidatus Bipolaricaulota bacterium]